MEDCCEWHGKLLAYNIVEEKYNTKVLANIHYCPYCHGISKSYIDLNNKEYLSERVWGDLRECYLDEYEKEINNIIEETNK